MFFSAMRLLTILMIFILSVPCVEENTQKMLLRTIHAGRRLYSLFRLGHMALSTMESQRKQ